MVRVRVRAEVREVHLLTTYLLLTYHSPTTDLLTCLLTDEDPSALKDPRKIDEAEFAEAQSVSFFEARPYLLWPYLRSPYLPWPYLPWLYLLWLHLQARLFLKGTYEEPVQLLGRRLERLAADPAAGRPAVRTWVAQGTDDEIEPYP